MELHPVWKTSPEIISQSATLSGKRHINTRVVEGGYKQIKAFRGSDVFAGSEDLSIFRREY